MPCNINAEDWRTAAKALSLAVTRYQVNNCPNAHFAKVNLQGGLLVMNWRGVDSVMQALAKAKGELSEFFVSIPHLLYALSGFSGEMSVKVEGKELTLQQSGTDLRLPIETSIEHWVDWKEQDWSVSIPVEGSWLWENLKLINKTAAKNDWSREVMMAVQVDLADYPHLVATDGRRMTWAKIPRSSRYKRKTLKPNIPGEARTIVHKLAKLEETVTLKLSSTHYEFEGSSWAYQGQNLLTKFPDRRNVVANAYAHLVSIEKKALSSAVRYVNGFATNKRYFNQIVFDFTDDRLVLHCWSDEAKVSTEVRLHFGIDEPMRMALNGKYLLDFLDTTKGDSVRFRFNEPHRSVMLKTNSIDDPTYLIMPIKLSADQIEIPVPERNHQ